MPRVNAAAEMMQALYIVDHAIEDISPELQQRLSGCHVSVLDLSGGGQADRLSSGWDALSVSQLFDGDAFRDDLIQFLDTWPRVKVWEGKSFDDLFRRRDGYSLWWTSVGCQRVSGSSPVRELKALWIVDRALREKQYKLVLVDCVNQKLANAVIQRCSDDAIDVRTESSARAIAAKEHYAGFGWAMRQFWRLLTLPPKALSHAMAVRLVCPSVEEHPKDRDRPAILFKPKLSRNVQMGDDGVELPYWDSFLEALAEKFPEIKPRFLLHLQTGKESRWKIISWLRTTGKQLIADLDGAIPPADRYSGLADWFCALPAQIAAILRFRKMESSEAFRASLRFAGCDVESVILPSLRYAVENMAEWERTIGQMTSACATVKNLRLVFLLGEFYPGPMRLSAVAKRLGVPVIGIQHGTIFPDHYVYTLPKGHVESAPIPDYFGAYGQYAKEIVCELGEYPRDRVRIIGAPRMDHLVNAHPDAVVARPKLNLPLTKKVVLIATHTPRTYPWFRDAVRSAFEATKHREDCLVCIKVHPGDRGGVDAYEHLAREVGSSNVRCYAKHFDELLAACDVLISGSSTTVLEATLLGKATISANFSDEPDRYPYVQDGASLPARNRGEMQHSIETLLSEDGNVELARRRQHFLERHLGPTSRGRGVDALVELTSELVLGVTSKSDESAPSCECVPQRA